MFSDCLTFKTPKLQRASMTVALLKLVLKKSGHPADALRLEGLDVTSPEMAGVALSIISAMPAMNPEVAQTRDVALHAVREALREVPVHATGN